MSKPIAPNVYLEDVISDMKSHELKEMLYELSPDNLDKIYFAITYVIDNPFIKDPPFEDGGEEYYQSREGEIR